MKVYIGCFGSGLGHASRMLEVAGELRSRGTEVRFSSSGEVVSLIRSKGFECNPLPLADVRYSESGEFALRQTVLDGLPILSRAASQVRLEAGNMIRFGPDAALSDSSLATVAAGKLLGLPTFTVLNQLNLVAPHGAERMRSKVLGTGVSAVMGQLWGMSDEILLPDLPPPYTISERNLWGSRVGKTRYVGFLSPREEGPPDEASVEFASSAKTKVFWPISGPPSTRAGLVRAALACAKALEDEYEFAVTGGSPDSNHAAVRIPGGWFYGWCEVPGRYFASCDAVVSRAGHATISQAILSSKPSLLIPILKQPEQEGNADKASRLGVSMTLEQSRLDPRMLRESLEELTRGSFKERAEALGAMANGMDAKAAIAETLASCSGHRHDADGYAPRQTFSASGGSPRP